ncbi:MAG: AraC family transcriptional regulator [Lacrimispora sp.]|jgi:AraC family transcriptional activator of mar-sox-rob regulon|nr:AraC family transcriptional regulator [Lacrimispora sp.]
MDEKKKLVSKIIDYVEVNLSAPERLNVEEIARHAGYSRFHLNRMFSEVTGCTIHRYVKERRLSEAARKLIMEEDSISRIAQVALYQSQQAFTLEFKKVYGCTPMTYRKARINREIRRKEVIVNHSISGRCAA